MESILPNNTLTRLISVTNVIKASRKILFFIFCTTAPLIKFAFCGVTYITYIQYLVYRGWLISRVSSLRHEAIHHTLFFIKLIFFRKALTCYSCESERDRAGGKKGEQLSSNDRKTDCAWLRLPRKILPPLIPEDLS